MRDPRLVQESGPEPSPSALQSVREVAREQALRPPDIAALRTATHDLVCGGKVFYDELISCALQEEERRRAWDGALRRSIRAAVEDATTLSLADKSIREEIEAWRGTADPLAIWQFEHQTAAIELDFELHLLLRLNPKSWLEVLDQFEVPSLMWMAAWDSGLVEDPDLTEHLMAQAPPLFDENGEWTRSVAAAILVRIVSVYAEQVHRALKSRAFACPKSSEQRVAAEHAVDQFERDELPARLRRFYETLLVRSDGRYIAYGLLQHLARSGFSARTPAHPWSVDPTAFDALASALASAGATVDEAHRSWQDHEALKRREDEAEAAKPRLHASRRREKIDAGEGRRHLHAKGLPFLLGALAIQAHTSSPAAMDGGLWSWFEELLVGRDPGLDWALLDTVIDQVTPALGALLAKLPDPAEAWRAAYRALEPQRRQAQFGFRYEGDGYQDRESLLLIYVGLQACAHRIEHSSQGHESAWVREVFWDLYAAARRLWLTAAADIGARKRNAVAACFAFMPAIFGDGFGRALPSALRAVSRDPWLFCRACSYMLRNGVAPEQLMPLASAAGLDLAAALRDAHEWSSITGQKDEFPSDFKDLAEAIGCTPSAPAPPEEPAEQRLARHRSLFLQRISWGGALLDRLERDGSTLTLLSPLDDKLTAWLVQTRPLESFQQTFGIAPELRILAVSGWVDGQLLERAQGDPRGASLVDPDLLVVANDRPDLAERLDLLPGPWGQRIPWPAGHGMLRPLPDQLRDHLPEMDLFERRDPVRGRQLIGRRRLIADLASRLVRGQSVGVFGLRKVGKSSLLGAVVDAIDPENAAAGGAEPGALVVSLDVQGIVTPTLDALVERLADHLRRRLDRAGLLQAGLTKPGELVIAEAQASSMEGSFEVFERLLRLALVRSSLPVCIVLDEYDLLFPGYGDEPGFAGVERLLGLLRALAQETHRVAVALIGRDPVFIEQPMMGGFTNPMLGWVVPYWLGPLHREEAEELLTRLGRRVGLDVGGETIELAWRWTGGHPLLLRQFGSALLEIARGRDSAPASSPTDTLREEAVRVFLQRDAVHTIVSEVKALLSSRFPEALWLLQDLADANGGRGVLEQHGGWVGDAARVLRKFGLLAGTAESPAMPEMIRHRLARAPAARRAKGRKRNARHGS